MIPDTGTGRPGKGWSRGWPFNLSIRIRLALALAVALTPVLLLGTVQSALDVGRQARDERGELVAAAERSAATARARIAAGEILLRTLGPGSIGLQCAPRLAEIKDKIPGYVNLIRFDALGRTACAAASVPPDAARRERPWFAALAAGAPLTITSAAGAPYADEPALLASVRATDPAGRFAGALTAVITLASLRPEKADRSLPPGSEVALADAKGLYLSSTLPDAFPEALGHRLSGSASRGSALWPGRDRTGRPRVFASAPLVGRNVYVLLSAPSPGLASYAWLNPVSAVFLPLLAFALALAAVWFVADRGVVAWIAYLRRIAAIYGRGRYTVHPVRALAAPPEIRHLAQTLDAMAATIAARDAALSETLARQDALMREIHHRVRNNLQVITSLLNLQQRALTDPAARAAVSDTRQRIAALALIYRTLYEGPGLGQVDLRTFLEDLIAQSLVGDTPGGGGVRTELDIDPLPIDPDLLAPLALFAIEAITNARKHGLMAQGGALKVALHAQGPLAELSITDSGVVGGAATVGEGVGRTLMTAFARQLRGRVEFCANPSGGLTARLIFPKPKAGAASLDPTLPRNPNPGLGVTDAAI